MKLRRIVPVGSALLMVGGLAMAQDAGTAANAAADLPARIDAIREQAHLPALGAALVTVDGLEGVWVTGTRRAGAAEKVEPGDIWHLGSCTKSMTATLVALLVARGDLSWDEPLPELLPEVAADMDDGFRDLTLVELLCHRAGLATAPRMDLFAKMRTSDFPPIELRAMVAYEILTNPPALEPRETFQYANDGFVIAGHIAELAAGKAWEELIEELLFRPLGMTSAGFGAPGTPAAAGATADQPRGHTPNGNPLEPGPMADNPPAIGPAGTVHASLADWAKYVQLHLRGEREDVKVGEITLTRDTMRMLHAPFDGPGQPYAFGWVVQKAPWAGGEGTTLWHNGSNTMWYCTAELGLANGVAVLVTTNQFTPAAQKAPADVTRLLIEEHQRRAGSAATR